MQENNLQDTVQAIKRQLSIMNLIGGYTSLKKKGNKYWGCCPFHNEKTASFSVSEDKGFFYCFGCHAGGDAINFLMRIKQQTFFEVVKDLAEQYNIPMPKNNIREVEPSLVDPVVDRIIGINNLAQGFFVKNLQRRSAEAKDALQYLSKRGIGTDIIERFSIGLSGSGWRELLDYLESKGCNKEILEQSGLFSMGQSGNLYDKFRSRIIIPIYNAKGEPIAFGGRVTQAEQQPKYLNSPETKAFIKRKTLFALHLAKPHIKKLGYTILTEGYMDAISMHVHGFENTVAGLGTAFTVEQAKLIGQNSRRLVLAYDNDTAGIQATIRAIELAKEAYLNVQVLDLSPSKDPDDFLQQYGSKVLIERLNNLIDPVSFQIEQTIKLNMQDNSLQQKVATLAKVLDFVKKIENALEIDNYLNLIAKKLMIDLALVQVEYSKLKGISTGFNKGRKVEKTGVPRKLNALNSAQSYIIKACLDDSSIIEYASEQITPEDFTETEFAEIIAAIFVLNESGSLTEENLLSILSDSAKQQALSIIFDEIDVKNTVKMVDDCIKQLKYNSLQKIYEKHVQLASEYEKTGDENFLLELKKAKEIKDRIAKFYL